MKSVINKAAIELIESRKRRSRVRNEEGTATISEILSRDEKTPYTTADGDVIRSDINKELMKACDGASVITIELEIEGKTTHEPGDYWTPPEGNEEREVTDGNVLIGRGDKAKHAESLSEKAIAYLSKLFQKEVDSAKIEYSETDYNEAQASWLRYLVKYGSNLQSQVQLADKKKAVDLAEKEHGLVLDLMNPVGGAGGFKLVVDFSRNLKEGYTEGGADIFEVLTRDKTDKAGEMPYITKDKEKIRDDVNKEMMKLSKGADVVTIEMHVFGKASHDYWDDSDPYGEEERELDDAKLFIGQGKAMQDAGQLSENAVKYLDNLFSYEIGEVDIDYYDPGPQDGDYDRPDDYDQSKYY